IGIPAPHFVREPLRLRRARLLGSERRVEERHTGAPLLLAGELDRSFQVGLVVVHRLFSPAQRLQPPARPPHHRRAAAPPPPRRPVFEPVSIRAPQPPSAARPVRAAKALRIPKRTSSGAPSR